MFFRCRSRKRLWLLLRIATWSPESPRGEVGERERNPCAHAQADGIMVARGDLGMETRVVAGGLPSGSASTQDAAEGAVSTNVRILRLQRDPWTGSIRGDKL